MRGKYFKNCLISCSVTPEFFFEKMINDYFCKYSEQCFPNFASGIAQMGKAYFSFSHKEEEKNIFPPKRFLFILIL